MNDLERDLKEMFETKARGVDVTPAAPEAVLRRGRRRQVGTVIGGAIGGLAVTAVAVAAVLSVTGTTTNVPANTNGLPERTTTIGGVPVTAPAGWTLVNDWPLAAVLSTSSETCTFTGTGTPVGGSGSDQETPAVEETCVQTPTDLPAGVPVLQLANFEVPLFETVCGLADQPATALPSDGVAVYVAAFPDGLSTRTFMDACPGSENNRDAAAVTTFAARDPEVSFAGTTYAAILVAGIGASPDDLEIGDQTMEELGGIRFDPTVPVGGPGYVLAAGTSGAVAWRFEAGIESLTDGPVQPSAVLTLTDLREAGTETVIPATGTDVESLTHPFDGSDVITFGTAGRFVEDVAVVTSEGTTEAVMFPWPPGLVTPLKTEPVEGTLWFARTTEPGEIEPILADASSTPSTDVSTVPGGAMETRTEGDRMVGTFEAFGRIIDIRVDPAGGVVFVEGDEEGGYSLVNDGSVHVDIAGGTLLVSQQAPGIEVSATTDDGIFVQGSWMDHVDNTGRKGRLWIVPLAGAGTGLLQVSDQLPMAISWPTHDLPAPGDVTAAAAHPDGSVSWALRWTDAGCPTIEVVAAADPGDRGVGACLVPFNDVPAVGGIYGPSHATVVLTGPEGMTPAGHTTSSRRISSYCTTGPSGLEGFAGTELCVIVIPVGETATINLSDAGGDRVGQQIRIEALPGSIDVGSGEGPS